MSKKLSKKFKKASVSKNNQQLIDIRLIGSILIAVSPKVGHSILKNLNFRRDHKIITFYFYNQFKKLKKIY